MPRRWFVLVGGLAVVAMLVGAFGDTLGQVLAQTTVAMTPWGEPDLQGIWTDPTDTNLQRRPGLGDREFYTEEEVAELASPTHRKRPAPSRGAGEYCGRGGRL